MHIFNKTEIEKPEQKKTPTFNFLNTNFIFNKIKYEYGLSILLFIVLSIGLIFDEKKWLVVTSACLIPFLFLILIFSYLKNDTDSIKSSLLWGALGFAMLILAIYSDKKFINENINQVILNISSTLISLSIIGIIFQLKDTKEYFAATLSELIMKESYVAKLNHEQLERLQKTVLERYFDSHDLNKEDSFYTFFRDNLQNFIGSPYRENYRNIIHIQLIDDPKDQSDHVTYTITDTVSYRIRSMGHNLQSELRWLTSKDEIRQIDEFIVTIDETVIFEWSQQTNESSAEQNDSNTTLVVHNFNSTPENGLDLKINIKELAKAKPNDIGKKYIDGATIKIVAKYSVTNYNSITTKVLFPTKGFNLTVFHTDNLSTKLESYGFDTSSNVYDLNKNDRGFTFNYTDWILPLSGLYVALEAVEAVSPTTSE